MPSPRPDLFVIPWYHAYHIPQTCRNTNGIWRRGIFYLYYAMHVQQKSNVNHSQIHGSNWKCTSRMATFSASNNGNLIKLRGNAVCTNLTTSSNLNCLKNKAVAVDEWFECTKRFGDSKEKTTMHSVVGRLKLIILVLELLQERFASREFCWQAALWMQKCMLPRQRLQHNPIS